MIYINLLPADLRPIKRTPIPYIVVGLILLGVLAGIGYMYVDMQRLIANERAKLDRKNEQYADIKHIVDEYNEMIALKKSLQSKIETINEIASDRIIWSEQLHHLSRLLPENMWYDGIEVDTQPDTVYEQVYNKQQEKWESKRRTIQRRLLVVSGMVIQGEEGKDVSPLVQALEEDPEFSELFEMEPLAWSDTFIDGVPVRSFTMRFVIRGQAGVAES